MSVEITLYTKKATKTGLTRLLDENGFQKVDHVIEEMNNENNLHYMWFGFENHESNVGVEATVIKIDDSNKKEYKCSDWILHTRTRAGGTYEEKAKQNEIIRIARKKFGGSFYNDWYGTNRYTNLDDYEKLQPHEKAVFNIKENAFEKLNQIINCLDSYKNPMSEHLQSIGDDMLGKLLKTKDPSITLYNGLIPFLVSVIEYFFGETFVNFITYDSSARDLIVDEKVKIGVSEVVKIQNKETSLERIISETYNFQNLDSINKAYKKYLRIDVFAILSKRKKVNGNIFRVLTKLKKLVDSRHKIIHNLEFNIDLTKEDYITYVKTVEMTIEMIIDELKKKKNLKIEMYK